MLKRHHGHGRRAEIPEPAVRKSLKSSLPLGKHQQCDPRATGVGVPRTSSEDVSRTYGIQEQGGAAWYRTIPFWRICFRIVLWISAIFCYVRSNTTIIVGRKPSGLSLTMTLTTKISSYEWAADSTGLCGKHRYGQFNQRIHL